MRYLPSLPPLPSVTDSEGPRPVRAARPASRVEPHTLVSQVPQRFRRKGQPAETGGGRAAPLPEKRRENDRRQGPRRQQQGRPFLDTRNGVDRRTKKRRDDDSATSVNERI